MRKVILYIAMSLDGYIADREGSVNWITGQDETADMPDTYTPFFKNVGTVIMGRSTYDQITTELSPGKWPYAEAVTYVLTHRTLEHDVENIKFTGVAPCHLIENFRQGEGKNIWICGGADVANQLLRQDLIDVFHLSIIPVILGGGVRLFATTNYMLRLKLTGTQTYNGIVETIYERQ